MSHKPVVPWRVVVSWLSTLLWLLPLASAGALDWESVSGDWYRPGNWWGVRVNLPADFPGSTQRFTAALDDWEVVYSGPDVTKTELLLYFPVHRPFPNLTWQIIAADGPTTGAGAKSLALRPLDKSAYLIGIYGATSMTDTIFAWNTVTKSAAGTTTPTINIHGLSVLPDRHEGLAAFNLLVLEQLGQTTPLTEATLGWVAAGGCLVLFTDDLSALGATPGQAQPVLRQKYFGQLPESDRPQVIELGRGTLICLPMPDTTAQLAVLANLWPVLAKQFLPRTALRFGDAQMPSVWVNRGQPQVWDQGKRKFLWCLSVGYLVTMAALVGGWLRYVSRKTSILTMLLLMTIYLGILGYVFYSPLPLIYRHFSLTQLFPEQSVRCDMTYGSLYPLRDQSLDWACHELPLPIVPQSSRPWPRATLVYAAGKYRLVIPSLTQGQTLVWKTEQWEFMAGEIVVMAAGQRLHNETAITLADCLYVDETATFASLGHWQSGQQVLLAESNVPRRYLMAENLPAAWRQDAELLFYLKGQCRSSFIVGKFLGNLPMMVVPKLVNHQTTRLVWLQLPQLQSKGNKHD